MPQKLVLCCLLVVLGACDESSSTPCAGVECGPGASCRTSSGPAQCRCDPGYDDASGDGSSCVDIDECATGQVDCPGETVCQNRPGTYRCACPAGYRPSGETCVEDDECAAGSDECHALARCVNTPGSYACFCPEGYQGDGRQCVAYDACATDPEVCDPHATCRELGGWQLCVCATGWSGNGITCADVDECANSSQCGGGTCVNSPGDFACQCPAGYEDNGQTCVDTDECVATPTICGPGTCFNEVGSHRCLCPPGLLFDGQTCVDEDECATHTATCASHGVCSNSPGSYTCACATGYTGDGFTCSLLTDCQANAAACSADASCVVTPDGPACVCNPGFVGDGASCAPAGWLQLQALGDATCGVRADGTLWCWGWETPLTGSRDEVPAAPRQLGTSRGWRQVAFDSDYSCGVKGDGTLWCWGTNPNGARGCGTGAAADYDATPCQVGVDTDWRSVSRGYGTEAYPSAPEGSSCAIKLDGSLWCWGGNSHGQLGNGSTAASTVPVRVGTESTWQQVEGAGSRNCALKNDLSVWCWGVVNRVDAPSPVRMGNNLWRRLLPTGRYGIRANGILVRLDEGTTLYPPEDGENWQTACAPGLVCGIKQDGSLWCGGNNDRGQAGRPPQYDSEEPQAQIGTATDWVGITCGYSHACAWSADGGAYCWGDNASGQLGKGAAGSKPSPARVGTENSWTALSLGLRHACALRDDGSLWCWGDAASSNWQWGLIGTGEAGLYDQPVQIGAQLVWEQVSAGGAGSCGVTTDHRLWCWGSNGRGELGVENRSTLSVPTQVGTDQDWRLVRTDQGRSCALKLDGSLWCMGDSYGATPTRVGSESDWIAVAVIGLETCGLRAPGSLWCDGFATQIGTASNWVEIAGDDGRFCARNADGEVHCSSQGLPEAMGLIASPASWSAVGVGDDHSCGIAAADSSLWCWGDNTYWQLGVVNRAPASAPVQVGTDTDWAAVDGGLEFSCGLKTDGSLWCWGTGTLGMGDSFSMTPLRVVD